MPGGPRPIRSLAEPWGVPGLNPAEARALQLGSDLMRTTIEILYAAVAAINKVAVKEVRPLG